MEVFKIENLSFTYPNRINKAIDSINLTINNGEFITLCGKSGCGKTTLLRMLKSILAPIGNMEGNIFFNNKLLKEYDLKDQACNIGFVMQNPDNQIVTDKVWHELAFGLESLGYSTPEIRTRVSEMASFFGIQNWFNKSITELSGGQKQILNLASIMVMQPTALILDEPTSQLDPIAAQEFLNIIKKINQEIGTTIILTEHRLEETFCLSNRVIVMEEGKIIADDAPQNIGEYLKNTQNDMYMALPSIMRIYGAVEGNTKNWPITICEAKNWLENYSKSNILAPEKNLESKEKKYSDEVAVEVKDVWFRHEKELPDVIKGLNLKIKKGEMFTILGGNGTGKSTALSLISGVNAPYRGKVYINGEIISKCTNLYDNILGVLPQNPQSLFVKKTVYLDLLEMLSEKKLSKKEREEKIKKISVLCKIEDLLDYHPYDLSGGEQQRVALAKVLLKNPQILLLDEPTKGMDAYFKKDFGKILKDLQIENVTIIMVSHDIEFCAEYADECAMLFDGAITSIGTPREFFANKSFYTTAVNRMARTVLPKAILAEDVILACGGKVEEIKKSHLDDNIKKNGIKKIETTEQIREHKKISKRTLVASFLILFIIPLTIYAGIRFFGDRKYYFISFLIIFETLIPFAMVFESRKPQARELVIISALCAIAVAGRIAFFMLPQFKPVIALVIISGLCFGGETGFLVGAVTAFVSNFFFGQGPWVPWQMFALGIIGFIAGVIFSKKKLRKNKIALCIFGFIATIVIYGGIMNPSTVILSYENPTLEMFVAAYISGIPFDLIHATATAFFLWIISEPMIEKLERIKTKYGIIE